MADAALRSPRLTTTALKQLYRRHGGQLTLVPVLMSEQYLDATPIARHNCCSSPQPTRIRIPD
jgi:hypothetical protein